jgi:anti-sigma factor RsiW
VSECDAFRGLVSAYLDGELIGEDRTAFERHVAACLSCTSALAEERAIVGLVQRAGPLYEAPPALRASMAELLEGAPARSRPSVGAVTGLVALAAAVLVAAVLWAIRLPAPAPPHEAATEAPAPSEFATLAARSHFRYARHELPLDIRSDRPEEVSRWFSGRVPFHLALPDYAVGPGERKFYRLEGGRLVSFRNESAALVAYRMEEHPISVLVTSASLVQPSGGDVVPSGRLRFHVESVEGLKVITWTDNGLTYALASDLDVEATQSCLVCHGKPEDRRKIAPLRNPNRPWS